MQVAPKTNYYPITTGPIFATRLGGEIIVRQKKGIEVFKNPAEHREVPDPKSHINKDGFARLSRGHTLTFRPEDRGYPALAALFA